MNWRKWSRLCVLGMMILAVMATLPFCAEAASTEPTATEPATEPAEPNPAALGPILLIGTVLLVITWAGVIWLLRRVTGGNLGR